MHGPMNIKNGDRGAVFQSFGMDPNVTRRNFYAYLSLIATNFIG